MKQVNIESHNSNLLLLVEIFSFVSRAGYKFSDTDGSKLIQEEHHQIKQSNHNNNSPKEFVATNLLRTFLLLLMHLIPFTGQPAFPVAL